jgi:fatty acid desaturase
VSQRKETDVVATYIYVLWVVGCMGSMGFVPVGLKGHLLLALYWLRAVGNMGQSAKSYMAV